MIKFSKNIIIVSVLFTLMNSLVYAQEAETNKNKKIVQVVVDAKTDIRDYDKIDYSVEADKKSKFWSFLNWEEKHSDRKDLQASKSIPADIKALNNAKATDQRPYDEQINSSLTDKLGSNSNTDKLAGIKESKIELTVEKEKVPESKVDNTVVNTINNQVNEQDFKEKIEEPITVKTVEAAKTVDSTLAKSTDIITESKKTPEKVVVNKPKTNVVSDAEYVSPTAVDKKSVKKSKKNNVDIPNETKEIVEDKSYPGVSPKAQYKESDILEELIRSGLYEVIDDGRFIRIGKKK